MIAHVGDRAAPGAWCEHIVSNVARASVSVTSSIDPVTSTGVVDERVRRVLVDHTGATVGSVTSSSAVDVHPGFERRFGDDRRLRLRTDGADRSKPAACELEHRCEPDPGVGARSDRGSGIAHDRASSALADAPSCPEPEPRCEVMRQNHRPGLRTRSAAVPSGLFRPFRRRARRPVLRLPRFVTHIDDGAIAAVGSLYDELGVRGEVLDLMSSWVSHFRDAPARSRCSA